MSNVHSLFTKSVYSYRLIYFAFSFSVSFFFSLIPFTLITCLFSFFYLLSLLSSPTPRHSLPLLPLYPSLSFLPYPPSLPPPVPSPLHLRSAVLPAGNAPIRRPPSPRSMVPSLPPPPPPPPPPLLLLLLLLLLLQLTGPPRPGGKRTFQRDLTRGGGGVRTIYWLISSELLALTMLCLVMFRISDTA